MDEILEFFKESEKLKTELRHSWTSDKNRQESVAEHTWMMTLMAITLFDKIEFEIDKLKVLKMIIIHDLVEVYAGDVPAHKIDLDLEEKYNNEKKSLERLTKILNNSFGKEVIDLWNEFEEQETIEAKFAVAIDKLDVLNQHNLSDLSTWNEGDYRFTFVKKQDDLFNFSGFMRGLKNKLDTVTYQKTKVGGTLNEIPKENLDLFEKNHS